MAETTITDKKSFACDVVDKKSYAALSQDEKAIFEKLRNSMLEIFPVEDDNTYGNDAIKFAENFAFINLSGINVWADAKIKKALDEFKIEVAGLIAAAAPPAAAPPAAV